MACDSCIGLIVLAFLLSPVILQGIGMFGTDWVHNPSCDLVSESTGCSCQRKNETHSTYCGTDLGIGDLDNTASKFQAVSFGVLLLPVLFGILEAYFNSNSEDVGCLGTCSGALFLLYPVAGLCSLTGCIILKVKFSEFSLGSSLNYCVASGLEIIILTAIIIAVICYIRRRPRKEPTTNMSDGQLTTASPVEPVSFVSIHAQEETTLVVETEGGWVILRQLNVFHLIYHLK